MPEGHCPLGIANQSVPIAALSLELDLEIELHRYVTIVLDPRPCIALDPVSLRNLGIGTIPAIDKDGIKMLTFRFKGVAHPIFSGASWGFGGLSLPPHELLSYHASWEDIEGRKYSALVPRLITCLGFFIY